MRLYTIGHSTRTIDEFLALLNYYEIKKLVDVRTIPKSKRHPWFGQENLKNTLDNHLIQYLHFPELGGMRKPLDNSINMGWRNTHFRGYADHMQTPTFESALEKLNSLLDPEKNTCIMCAEAVPWRCHRSLIGDIEVARGIQVIDILNLKSSKEHRLTSFAVIDKTFHPPRVYYPSNQSAFDI